MDGDGDFDGDVDGEGDFDGLGEGDFGGRDDGGWTWDGTYTEDWVMAADGRAAFDVGAVAVIWAATGEVRTLVRAAWAWVARTPVGRVVWACAAREPAKVSNVTLTAATIHNVTAVAAIAGPGLARMPDQLTCLIACEIRASQTRSARRTTRRR